MSDNSSHEKLIDRRKVLKTVGASGLAVGLSGCSGNDGGSGSNGDSGDGSGDGGNGDDGGGGSADETQQEPDFPTEEITGVIYAPPGGGYDFYMRLVAKHLPDHLPNEVNVTPQNITGAGGRIAMNQVSNADAHTFTIMNLGRFSRNEILYDTEFDLLEFTMYPQVVIGERSIGVGPHTDIPDWETFAEKMANEELSIGSTGPTGGSTIILVVLGEVSGRWTLENVTNNTVTFDGTAPVAQAMLAGDVDVLASSHNSMISYYENDQARPLIYMTDEDSPPESLLETNSNVQTLQSAGVDNATRIMNTVRSGRGFGGPPGIPEERAQIMHDAILEALEEDEDLQQEAAEAQRPLDPAPGQQTRQVIESKIQTWNELSDILNELTSQSG